MFVLAGLFAAASLPTLAQAPAPAVTEEAKAPKKAPKKPDAAKPPAPEAKAASKAPPKSPPKSPPKAPPKAPAKAEAAKQPTKVYTTGPSVLRDKDGNVIPTNPEAYNVDSALPKK